MGKKPVSVVAPIDKKKPIKINNTKKLRKVLKNVLYYLKSDTYMFAPLISSQSQNPTADSFGDISWEPICLKKKLGENVKDYLNNDSYMYVPFIPRDPLKGSVGVPIKSIIMEGSMSRKDVDTIREIENEDISSQIVVKHKLLQRETVKHVVLHDCRPSSLLD